MFQRIDYESGKKEVVDGIALLCNLFVDAGTVFGMDFGEDDQPILLRNTPQTFQVSQVPGRLKKFGWPGALCRYAKASRRIILAPYSLSLRSVSS